MNRLLRLGVSGVLLGLIAWRTDWPKFAGSFAALHWGWWGAAVLLCVLCQVVSTFRWQAVARALGFDRPVPQLLGFYAIGMYFNLLLPTSVGGDVVRAWYLDGRSGRRLLAFVCVFLDRLSGLLALLALACLAVVLSPLELEPWISWAVWSMAGGALLTLVLLPAACRLVRLGERRVQKIRAALGILRDPGLFARTTCLSVIVQALGVIMVWLIGLALGASVPASFYWVLVPMVSLLTMLPISVNGMGVREMSMTVLLAPMGVGQDVAVALALLWFAASGLVSLAGGLVYLFGRFPRPQAVARLAAADLSTEDFDSDGTFDRYSDQGRTGQPRTAA